MTVSCIGTKKCYLYTSDYGTFISGPLPTAWPHEENGFTFSKFLVNCSFKTTAGSFHGTRGMTGEAETRLASSCAQENTGTIVQKVNILPKFISGRSFPWPFDEHNLDARKKYSERFQLVQSVSP